MHRVVPDEHLDDFSIRDVGDHIARPPPDAFDGDLVAIVVDRLLHSESAESVPLSPVVLAAIRAKDIVALPASNPEARVRIALNVRASTRRTRNGRLVPLVLLKDEQQSLDAAISIGNHEAVSVGQPLVHQFELSRIDVESSDVLPRLVSNSLPTKVGLLQRRLSVLLPEQRSVGGDLPFNAWYMQLRRLDENRDEPVVVDARVDALDEV